MPRLVLGVLPPIALLAISGLLLLFDNKTQLAPTHDSSGIALLIIPLASALLGGAIALKTWKRKRWWQRLLASATLSFAWWMSAFLVTTLASEVWYAYRDFPPASTKTFIADVPIARAYVTHGKRDHFYVTTVDPQSDVEIEERDFAFMQAHRRPEDHGENRDEIKSDGYFCAHVEMQEAGSARRILHAGSQTLRLNTVRVCPNLLR